MNSIQTFFSVVILAGLLFTGCESEFDSLVDANKERNPIPDTDIEASQGDADFSNFITIGNSLTAGFMDGALYNNGQEHSLGVLMSAQFEFAGAPPVFNQPDVNSENGCNASITGNCANPNPLGRFKLDTSIPGPSPTVNGEQITAYSGAAAELNNFGVPGIRVGDLLNPGVGVPSDPAFNPFYQRYASSPGSSTILDDAISSDPSFFTLWIGSNDVLGYALNGARNKDLLTSPEDFQEDFQEVVSRLTTETNADGVVATIPQILAIPFFRAVPYNAIPLDQETAVQVNAGFEGFDQVLDAIVENLGHDPDDADRRRVNYQAGQNPILIVDRNLENLGPKFDIIEQFGGITAEQREALQPYVQSRPIEQGELVLLSAASVLGTLADPQNPNTPIGVVIPLGPEFTLTFENQTEIETARLTFNSIIESTVTGASGGDNQVALYNTDDQDSAFSEIFGLDGSSPGITVEGVDLNPDFSPNGVFSTDGVHPNQRGNGIIANEFLSVIEDEFNAQLPPVDVLSLPSVSVCAGDCLSQQSSSIQIGQLTNINIDNSYIRR